ncbi:putative chitinase [Seiridium unicorne]|uniref:chitinase n=1 Tax=Seiridium unicorne TaxID=138068 RepID=A0ABR2V7N4_9PEZI
MAASFRGPFSLLFVLLFLHAFVNAQQVGGGGTCSDAVPCLVGCCSKDNQCGFTPEHCGDGCKSKCDSKAECGQYAAEGNEDCPINVCCSKWGFCGTTTDFCGDGCQKNSDGGGCGDPSRPSCTANNDALSYERRIGYYELFNLENSCNVFQPEDIEVTPLTHLNLAFVNFDSSWELNTGDGNAIYRCVNLKINNPALHVSISVGGWTFNDGDTAMYWSTMASSYTSRQTFVNSVVSFLREYALDGIDLDWEYPSAGDRGGQPDDAENYVLLVSELREAFDAENPGWTITVTLPTSYWYLRGFLPEEMQKYVSWFNLMSYDLHGMWDHDNIWTGPYLEGHTDITQIDLGLDLLWRNNIKPENVVFGTAFYGRSFTLSDPNCNTPNGICEFTTGGTPGTCSATAGILTYQEISAKNSTLDVQTFYNATTTVKYNVFNGDQWVSYDDQQSWWDKKSFLSGRCLSGIMVWALDQDDGQFDAISGLMGDYSLLQMEGGGLSPEQLAQLAEQFGAYTGQNCYVTPTCTDGSPGQKSADQVCGSGFTPVSTAHTPLQRAGYPYHGECSKGWYRSICCPTDAMPKNCAWNGAPVRSEFGCEGSCGSDQFLLNTDSYTDALGNGNCYTGTRALCCDSTAIISDCYWSPCQGPLSASQNPECNEGYDYQTFRYDKPDGSRWCSDTYVSPLDGSMGSPVHQSFKSALCCPTGQGFSTCNWSNDPSNDNGILTNDPSLYCQPQACAKGQVKVADALDPPPSPEVDAGPNGVSCDSYSAPPGLDMHYPYCCAPQSKYNEKWPVDPKKLFQIYYDDPGKSDVVWQYSDEWKNNDDDDSQSSDENGSDAYGFVMLDGPEGSIDNSFSTSQTVIRQTREIPSVKRSVVTSNQTLMDSVFEHSEETFHVFCNYPINSPQCNRIFIDGAEDTIIRLPDHIGEGPFARIVSMELADASFPIPGHHLQHRRSLGLDQNPVYKVKIDYNFHLITPKRDDQPINIRVDYTNLLGYWDEMTDANPSRKRGEKEKGIPDWHSRVNRAIQRNQVLRKRTMEPINITAPIDTAVAESRPVEDVSEHSSAAEKRWWGTFVTWLQRLTTVTKSELGVIPLGWSDTINLFYAKWGCPGNTFYADLRMDLEANLQMDVTYAYYFSAAFVPPGTPETFAYIGMDPSAYIGLKVVGNAIAQYTTGRKKIIDTLTYPGLAVKGIAAVGPTLDVYGEIRGKITLRGEARAGAQLHFGKTEVYWPENDDAAKYMKLAGITNSADTPAPGEVSPTFEAGVRLDAGLDVIVTPQANVGIKIGGGSLVGGTTLMDAQLSGFVKGDLSFQASGEANTKTNAFDYSYGVYIFYNLGYSAKATILGVVNWATGDRSAFTPDQMVPIYGPVTGSIDLSGSSSQVKRSSAWTIDEFGDLEDPLGHNSSSWMPLLPRADDDPSDLSPNDPEFTQNLQCPASNDGDMQLPELRFNCDLLNTVRAYPTAITIGKSAQIVEGVCDGWKSMNQRQTILTYSANSQRNRQRRRQSCPQVAGKTYCRATTDLLYKVTGLNAETQCDEAPWASTEEGGNWLPAQDRSSTCVPAYQNAPYASACQALMAGGNQNAGGTPLQSNWGRMDPDIALDDQEDNWVRWDDNAWTTAGDHNGNEQKAMSYPQAMPPPDGMTSRPDEMTSWFYRRSYTWSYIEGSAQASQWWGVTSDNVVDGGNAIAGFDAIVCALNHFDQDTIYKLPVSAAGSTYNGYCLKNVDLYTLRGWQNIRPIARCRINFGDGGTTKRGENGYIRREDAWRIESIEYIEDVSDEELQGFGLHPEDYDDIDDKVEHLGDDLALRKNESLNLRSRTTTPTLMQQKWSCANQNTALSHGTWSNTNNSYLALTKPSPTGLVSRALYTTELPALPSVGPSWPGEQALPGPWSYFRGILTLLPYHRTPIPTPTTDTIFQQNFTGLTRTLLTREIDSVGCSDYGYFIDSEDEFELELECEARAKYLHADRPCHPAYVGDVIDDKYRIEHKLGFGGSYTVCLAYDIQKKQSVALKILTMGSVGLWVYLGRFPEKWRANFASDGPRIDWWYDHNGQSTAPPNTFLETLEAKTYRLRPEISKRERSIVNLAVMKDDDLYDDESDDSLPSIDELFRRPTKTVGLSSIAAIDGGLNAIPEVATNTSGDGNEHGLEDTDRPNNKSTFSQKQDLTSSANAATHGSRSASGHITWSTPVAETLNGFPPKFESCHSSNLVRDSSAPVQPNDSSSQNNLQMGGASGSEAKQLQFTDLGQDYHEISATKYLHCTSDETLERDGDDVQASQTAQVEHSPPSQDLLGRCDSPSCDARQTASSDATNRASAEGNLYALPSRLDVKTTTSPRCLSTPPPTLQKGVADVQSMPGCDLGSGGDGDRRDSPQHKRELRPRVAAVHKRCRVSYSSSSVSNHEGVVEDRRQNDEDFQPPQHKRRR